MSDKFVAPKPTFNPTDNQNVRQVITPNQKDTTPAPSVVERLQQEGHTDLAEMLAQAEVAAKDNAVILADTHTRTRKKEPLVSWEQIDGVQATPTIPTKQVAEFQPSDVCSSDREFVIRTRTLEPHSPQAKALFYANGGEQYLTHGRTYAQAWDLMRRTKMQAAMRKQ